MVQGGAGKRAPLETLGDPHLNLIMLCMSESFRRLSAEPANLPAASTTLTPQPQPPTT